ncbi:MAG: hypothetical protein IPG45_01830 [Deltaproteobacteria bacterium]|nr:hypothetical protein [Deltaproteobacteria bacterium]
MDAVKRNAQYLLRLVDGLAQPISAPEAQAVERTVRSLKHPELLDLGAIEGLGLAPKLEAALVFQLLSRRYPDQVKAAVYSAHTLSGVFLAVLGAKPEADPKRAVGQAPEFVTRFVDQLHALRPESDGTGTSLGAVRGAKLVSHDLAQGVVRLKLEGSGGEPDRDLSLHRRDDGAFDYQVAGGKRQRVETLDLPGLRVLHQALHAATAGGAQDPMLALLRRKTEADRAAVLKEAAEHLGDLVTQKAERRTKELEQLRGALEVGFADFRVGFFDKDRIDALAKELFAAPGKKD